MVRRLLTTLALSAVATAVQADVPDHPLLSRYPDAKVRTSLQLDYERVSLPSGLRNPESGVFPMKSVVGDVTKHYYLVNNVSTLKLYENYTSALNGLGFSTVFSCEGSACGSDDDASDLGDLVSVQQVYNYYRKPYYVLAEKAGEKGKVWVSLFIGRYDATSAVQQMIVEEEPLDAELIEIDREYLQKQPPATVKPEGPTGKPGEDHPLVSRYPGATIRDRERVDYEAFRIPVGVPTDPGGDIQYEALDLKGDLSRHFYMVPNTSTLKVHENYKAALAKAGFTTTFTCSLDECGDGDQASALGALLSVDDNVYNYYRRPYYLVAERKSGDHSVYVAVFAGGYEDETAVQQVVLETRELQDDLVTVDADSLGRELEETGKALIYGIYFDTDKSTLKPESKPTLDAIAELLKKQSDLLLYVVGHTDDTGPVAHNLQLSSARADAVVEHLTENYQVASGRLVAKGVGPFAPESTNLSDDGKRLNRRVELVRRLK